jgi:hypothetical protein
MPLLTLFALGLAISAAAMGALWFLQERTGSRRADRIALAGGGRRTRRPLREPGRRCVDAAIGDRLDDGLMGRTPRNPGAVHARSNRAGNVDAVRPAWVFPGTDGGRCDCLDPPRSSSPSTGNRSSR